MSLLEIPTVRTESLRRPFVVLGALWLLLAAVVTITHLTEPPPITVEWRTETEINAAGFNVYRASSVDGPYSKLNDELIPGEGGPTSGASYVYVDDNVQPGTTYYYRLEDIELDNSAVQHPPLEFTAPRFPWWLPLLVTVSVIVGFVLLLRGLKSERTT